MARTLVTGGAGFVGSGLVRRLLELNHEVLVLDDFSKGCAENLPDSQAIRVIQGDIRDRDLLQRVMELAPDHVFHLAAHHYIPFCNANPEETISVNVLGTQCVLSAAKQAASVRKFVFASTAAVYAPSTSPHLETELPGPIDIYGISKQCGELLTGQYHHETQVPVVNARLFNVIGPRETNPHLLPDIIGQLPGPLIRLGNLMPRRDYIHVDDVAAALTTLLTSELTNEAVNVGSGHAYSAQDVVMEIAEAIGNDLKIESIAERQRAGDRPVLVADKGKLEALGWKCQHDFKRAVRSTLRCCGVDLMPSAT